MDSVQYNKWIGRVQKSAKGSNMNNQIQRRLDVVLWLQRLALQHLQPDLWGKRSACLGKTRKLSSHATCLGAVRGRNHVSDFPTTCRGKMLLNWAPGMSSYGQWKLQYLLLEGNKNFDISFQFLNTGSSWNRCEKSRLWRCSEKPAGYNVFQTKHGKYMSQIIKVLRKRNRHTPTVTTASSY